MRQLVESAWQSALGSQPKDLVGFVSAVMQIVRDYDVAVHASADAGGRELRFDFADGTRVRLSDPRAAAFLRMMCANLAVRLGDLNGRESIMFGGEGFIAGGPESDSRWRLRMMNTMSEHWFDLSPERSSLN